ncbi:hypothetical protein [Arthrobacter sp. AQ5-05]|uniref:hypothetical protein n=1 Tax=Arthrobacter sp. AQ5-05 TaxID=2184581 RepID=UPI0012B556BE|nr:hypothetical protein [Arthrobacter sp. AQ5-05]
MIRHRGALAAAAMACVLALTGCVSVPIKDRAPAPAGEEAAHLSYLDRLKATPVGVPTEAVSSTELPQFVSDSRNVACVFTTSKAGHLNQPWEPNNFGDSANATAPAIPVVNCQMAVYPQPRAGDVVDNCAGTNIGYLGGTALLYPDKVVYGGCRAGVTAVEASVVSKDASNQFAGGFPVLAPGTAMEAQGYRCASMDTGVACANLTAGIGFFLAANTYELFGPGPAPLPGATTPATAPVR